MFYIVVTNWGAGFVILQQKYLETLARGRSDVAIGCSKLSGTALGVPLNNGGTLT
jgi:hypothetical protein